MNHIRRRSHVAGVIVAVLVVVSTGCRKNPPNTTPQANIAHYGVDVVNGIKQVQAVVVRATDATPPVMTVQQAEPIMNTIRTALDRGNDLSAALKAYDAATSAPDRQNQASKIEALIQTLTSSLARVASSTAPPGVSSEISSLAGNVTATLATIRASLALHGGGAGELPPRTLIAVVIFRGGVR